VKGFASMHQPGESSQLATALRDFMKLESAGGILLLIAAIAAMLVANSPLASLYDALLDTTVAVQVGAFVINKPLLLWINDGLMAVFFFLIGLEIKREIMEGELSSLDQVILPGMGALGGMAMMGMSLNMISMFAIIMGLGIIVDDAIVIGEHTEMLHRRGMSPEEATRTAATVMFAPVLAASLTTSRICPANVSMIVNARAVEECGRMSP